MEIAWRTAERMQLRDMFSLAEDSSQRLEASMAQGRVLVATHDGQILGYLQLVDSDLEDTIELRSMAVADHCQRKGVGRALVERAITECRAERMRTLLVATASADVGNLRFYQRLGFRVLRIERDAFTVAGGYPEGLTIDGIPLRDRVWLTLALQQAVHREEQSPRDWTMQLRIARHTERLEELVGFYRDGVGLTQTGGFRDHDGYDGVFLEVPGSGAHLELTAGGGHSAPAPHSESLLVFYLGDTEAVQEIAARLGVEPVLPANPYWAEHGLTFQDPDGFRVVLVRERWESLAPGVGVTDPPGRRQ